MTGTRWTDRWIAVGLAAVSLAVYLRSLLPGVGYSGDTAKWQFLGEVGGVPHPTGYPLYLTLNRAFVELFPWGSLAWRANLLSAVLGAVAVALLFLLARLVGVSRPAAAAAAAACAVTPALWTQAVVAEVYTLHLVLMAVTLLCMGRWRLGGSNGWLLAGLAVYALSFGNHMGMVLLLPGLVWLVWSDRRRALSFGNAVWVAVVAVLGAVQYGYVVHLARTGRYVEHPVTELRDVASYVTGSYFRSQMFTFDPVELLTGRLWLAAQILVEDMGPLLVLAAVGLWAGLAGRRWPNPAIEGGDGGTGQRDLARALALWAAAATFFAMNYDIPNIIVYFIPAVYASAVFVGLGLDQVGVWLRALAERRQLPTGALVLGLAVGLVALPVVGGLVNYRRASQRGAVTDAARIELLLETAGRDAVLLTDGYHDSQYIWYYLLGEGLEDSHNLELANMVSAEQVASYLRGDDGQVRHAAARVAQRVGGMEMPPLYMASADQAAELAEHSIPVVEVTPGVWAVAESLPGGSA